MVRKVAVIMGSDSDWPVVKGACAQLKALDIPFEAHILSAHRTPAEAAAFAKGAKENGFGVILCAAGMAAHLAGAFAANTTLPVIGIPMKGGAMDGLWTPCWPCGAPAACSGHGGLNGAEARRLAGAEILALGDEALAAVTGSRADHGGADRRQGKTAKRSRNVAMSDFASASPKRVRRFSIYDARRHRGWRTPTPPVSHLNTRPGGCGIAVSDDGVIGNHRDLGLVSEVFTPAVLALWRPTARMAAPDTSGTPPPRQPGAGQRPAAVVPAWPAPWPCALAAARQCIGLCRQLEDEGHLPQLL